MKKLIISILSMLFVFNVAQADVKIGISGTGTSFSDAKGSEEHKGNVTNEKDTLEAAFGSIFVEASVLDLFSIGFDYIPYTIEGETVENVSRNAVGGLIATNRATVDIEEHKTLYVLVPFGATGVYGKLGASHADVDVSTDNTAGTTYSDEELLGGHLSLGYEKDFSMLFVRAEAGLSHYGTVESESSSKNNRIKATLGDGIHARISVGKSF